MKYEHNKIKCHHIEHRGFLAWVSPDVITYIYTVFFKPHWIRTLVQFCVKAIIPNSIQIKGTTIYLNKQDAIVSGALALGCYEKDLLDFFVEILKPDMYVVDIGANIGLYTVIAAKYVGSNGHVISIEPEPSNCTFIHKSLQSNFATNSTVFQVALSNYNGESKLFLCDNNNADHRIYDSKNNTKIKSRKSIMIRTSTLDDLLGADLTNKIDLIKMDIQGAEALAIEGMQNILSHNKQVKIIMEYWPWGLIQAGSNPIKLLQDLRMLGFKIFEFTAKRPRLLEVLNDTALASRTLERQHANLFLTRA